ncbi:hypothetical protein Slin15195_G044590 [Septoria linicola]|uniref:Uncharacterized protein n=1 Tax=Septoria linicola TaxID=215465 RepID=A0A9Q9ALD7_9PEZI|nr:hypothetical protein Slin14017_G048110 [Septoria linicola]USW51140.1 hypothetical protein Slin15195_G044590 [Septoria linicola]
MAKPKDEWDLIDFMDAPHEEDWLPKDEWQFAEDLLRVAVAAKEGPLEREKETKAMGGVWG